MARARRIRGIKPKDSLGTNARRVVELRLAEFLSWRTSLDDPTAVQDLHDMRIAAKRLRYAFEMFEVCYSDSKSLLKELTDIQETLGDIHDLDVLTDLLRARLKAIDANIETAAIEIMSSDEPAVEKSRRLRRVLSAQARDRQRLGLIALIGDKIAERGRRYADLQTKWGGAALDDFALRVRRTVGLVGAADAAASTSESGDGSVKATRTATSETSADAPA